eukprot:403361974
MLYEVTQDILDLIKPFSSMNANVALRHYDKAWSNKDQRIRTQLFYHSESKFNTQGFVTFRVPKKCKCSWPSAFGTFEILYVAYHSRNEQRFYVYVTALIYKQKCRKHGRYADPIMSDDDLSILCKSFWTFLAEELQITNHYGLQELKEKEEEVKVQLKQSNEKEAEYQKRYEGVDRLSEKFLEMVIKDYDENLKEKLISQEKEDFNQKSSGRSSLTSSAQKTKGKHVSSLCQACQMGACTYTKKLLSP